MTEMTIMADWLGPREPTPGHVIDLDDHVADRGVAIYAGLIGCHPAVARVDSDHDFDRHVLASLLAVGASEGGMLAARVGLGDGALTDLVGRWFPQACGLLAGQMANTAEPNDDEVMMVRDLLLAHRSTPSDESRWLAFMVARRAMEPIICGRTSACAIVASCRGCWAAISLRSPCATPGT